MKSALMKILIPLFLLSRAALAADTAVVTAIDILLEPDTTMLDMQKTTTPACSKSSRRASPWMRRIAPHITVIECFVRTADWTRSMPPPIRFCRR